MKKYEKRSVREVGYDHLITIFTLITFILCILESIIDQNKSVC